MTGAYVVISGLFFLSGITGLVYEVVWAKHLALFLGNTSQAHTIVLATFMGGLAIGYFLFGKLADRAASALALYGWLEIAIGFLAGLFIPLLGWMGEVYITLVRQFGLDSPVAASLRLFLTTVLILLPTLCMGGTLPVLSRYLIRALGEVESRVGWLYFLNSLGAVCGSLVAGFVLIPWLGLNLSILAAAALNLAVGLVAIALKRWEQHEAGSSAFHPARSNRVYTAWETRIALVGIAFSGAAALIYEIAWIRLLSLVLGSSTYSFSLMLAAFIAGIALGSFLVSRRWTARVDPFALFGLAELGVALSVVLTLPIYERLPYYFVLWANLFVRAPETFWLYGFMKFFLCFALMLLPTLFLGMTLPSVSQVCAQSFERLGQRIGDVFAVNTLGTLLGAVAAGLWLLPLLGLKRLFEFGVSVNLAIAVFALGALPGWEPRRKVVALGCGLALFSLYLYLFPAWDKVILSSGVFREKRFYTGLSYDDFKRRYNEKILYYKDGANMTVTVAQQQDDHITLKVNGKVDASSGGDLPTQILLGQVPLLLKPDARRVLVIGLGSGITAGSVLRHPVERLDVVEISPEVVEGSRFFAPHNYDALKDPRLRLHIEDAKTFLKVAPEGYDVIISEPSNPWIAGVGNLFSVEFYRDARARLAPDGLMVQWFHTYEMTDETIKLVLRTFADSFSHVSLWAPTGTDFLLVGSNTPFSLDFQRSLARLSDPEVTQDLRRIGIGSLPTILTLQVASDAAVRQAAGRGRLNEDLFPVLEYDAPKAFFLGQTSQLLHSYDQRRYPGNGSPLYFTEYRNRHQLGTAEIKNVATYHIDRAASSQIGITRAFVELWLQRAPGDPEAHWAMARIHQQAGNSEAARKELRYLVRLRPENQEYLEAASRLELQIYLERRSFLKSSRPDKALGYLFRLLEMDGVKKGRIYRKIAEVYKADRDYRSAMRYLDKAARGAQNNNQGEIRADLLWLEAADLAIEIDDLKSALEYAGKALAYNPQSLAAKRRFELLSREEKSRPRGH